MRITPRASPEPEVFPFDSLDAGAALRSLLRCVRRAYRFAEKMIDLLRRALMGQ